MGIQNADGKSIDFDNDEAREFHMSSREEEDEDDEEDSDTQPMPDASDEDGL